MPQSALMLARDHSWGRSIGPTSNFPLSRRESTSDLSVGSPDRWRLKLRRHSPMTTKVTILLAAALLAPIGSPGEPTTRETPTPTPDQVVEQFRTDLQAKRADVMAK